MKYSWQSFMLLLLSLLLLPATRSSYPLPPPSPPLHVSYYHTNNGICCRVHLCVSWYLSDVYLLMCVLFTSWGGLCAFLQILCSMDSFGDQPWSNRTQSVQMWMFSKVKSNEAKTQKLNIEMLSNLNVRHMTVVKNIRAGQGIWVMC